MTESPADTFRYPGARSFADTEVDRKVFFGREAERDKLFHTVLSESLVVVYGKSGTGKTSLINAGLKEPLRQRDFLPLVVRVNDPASGPWSTIYDAVEIGSRAQGVELEGRDRSSPWRFFSGLRLWRDDKLLTPVIIFDQFEEIFTLHEADARARFVNELAPILRGRAPESTDPKEDESDLSSPRLLKAVISLREEFLGNLDELATDVPSVLNARFRLGMLSPVAAAAAIEHPSRIVDRALVTRPFQFAPGTVDRMLKFLSSHSKSQILEATGIEAFQLQLVCQHVEEIARQRTGESPVSGDLVTVDYERDLGGDEGLRRIIRGFYSAELAHLSAQYPRRNIEALCERGLISGRGRRLSLEVGEIAARFGVSGQALTAMVDRRLLRAEPRVGSMYYELSHDTLVEPILASRLARRQAQRQRTAAAAVVSILLLGGGGLYLWDRLNKINELAEGPNQAIAELEQRPDSALARSVALAGIALRLGRDVPPRVADSLLRTTRQALSVRVPLAEYGQSTTTLGPDGRILAVVNGNRLRLVDRGGALLADITLDAAPQQIAFSAGGNRLALVSGRRLEGWDIAGARLGVATDLPSAPRAVAFHPFETTVIAQLSDGRLSMSSLDGSTTTGNLEGSPTLLTSLSFNRDGSHLAGVTEDGSVAIWRQWADALWEKPDIYRPTVASPVSGAGSFLAMAHGTDAIVIDASKTPAVTARVKLARADAPSRDDTSPSWRIETEEPLEPAVTALSADGRFLVVGGPDRQVVAFSRAGPGDGSEWQRTARFESEGGVVTKVAVSPDGQLIAVAHRRSGNVLVTDATGVMRQVLTGAVDYLGSTDEPVDALAFLPDRLVVGHRSTTASIWSLPKQTVTPRSQGDAREAGEQINQSAARQISPAVDKPPPPKTLERNHAPESSILALAADPRGRYLVVADDENRLEAWRPSGDGLELVGLTCLEEAAKAITLSSDGGQAVIVGKYGGLTAVSALDVFVASARKLTVARSASADEDRSTSLARMRERYGLLGNKGLFDSLTRGPSACRTQVVGRAFDAFRGHFRNIESYYGAVAAVPAGRAVVAVNDKGDLVTHSDATPLTASRTSRLAPEAPPIQRSELTNRVTAFEFELASGGLVVGSSQGALYHVRHEGSYFVEGLPLQAHSGEIRGVSHGGGPDGIVSLGSDGRIRLWPADFYSEAVPRLTLETKADPRTLAADSAWAATQSAGALDLHDLTTLRAGILEGDRFAPEEKVVDVDPRGRYFLTFAGDTLTVRDLVTAVKLTWSNRFDQHCDPSTAAIAPDGETVLVGCSDGQVESTTFQLGFLTAPEADGDGHPTTVAAFAPRGAFAVGHDNGRVSVWSAEGDSLASWEAHQSAVTALALIDDGDRGLLAASTSHDRGNHVSLWRVTEKKANPAGELVPPAAGTIVRLVFDEPPSLLSLDQEGIVREWDWRATSSTPLHSYEHGKGVADFRRQKNSGALLTVDVAGCLREWPSQSEGPDIAAGSEVSLIDGACKSKPTTARELSGRWHPSLPTLVTNWETPSGHLWDMNPRTWLNAPCQRLAPLSRRPTAKSEPWAEALDACRRYAEGARDGADDRLLRAATGGDLGEIASALKDGASIAARDSRGRTALALAARGGRAASVTLLLAHDSDPNATDLLGETPVHEAAWGGDLVTLKLLLARGGAIDRADLQGVTPVMTAAARKNLIKLGLNTRGDLAGAVAADSGLTPILVATARGDVRGLTDLLKVKSGPEHPRDTGWRQSSLDRLASIGSISDEVRKLSSDGKLNANRALSFRPRLVLGPPYLNRYLDFAADMVAWQQGLADDAVASSRVNSLRGAVDAGDADALLLMGFASSVGFGTARDDTKALALFRESSKRRNQLGRTMTGLSLLFGRGAIQDVGAGIKEVQGAAEAGDSLALHAFGILLIDGMGVTEDRGRGLKLLNEAAAKGFGPGINSSGWFTDPFGAHVSSELRESALKDFERAAEAGDFFAEQNRGFLLENARNFKEAAEIYLHAWTAPHKEFIPWVPRVMNYPDAASALADLAGRPGPQQSMQQKIMWLRRASEGGYDDEILAWVLEHGLGTPPDFPEAIRHYRRAAVFGSYFAWSRLRALGVAP